MRGSAPANNILTGRWKLSWHMTDAEFRAHGDDVCERLHDNQVALARVHGQLDARLDSLRDDNDFVDGLRALEWRRADPSLGLELRDGKIHGIPDGWPEGVDGEQVVDDHLATERTHLLPQSTTGIQPEPNASPLVSDFRSRVKRGAR